MWRKTLQKPGEILEGRGDVTAGKSYFAQNQCDPFGRSRVLLYWGWLL